MRLPPEGDRNLLSEAAEWLVRLQYEQSGETERQAFQQWHAQSSAHAAAWQKVQQVMQALAPLQGGAGEPAQQALKTLAQDGRGASRRRNLRRLGMLLIAGPSGWLAWRQLPWRQWTADVATATGERRTETLPDGSGLTLNTGSAVNIVFSGSERRLLLVEGEILVTTHADTVAPETGKRPFVVETAHGIVEALGTRFGVRKLDQDSTRVAVFEHAVRVQPWRGAPLILKAGEQARFDRHAVAAPEPADAGSLLWQNGMLLARDQRLDAVITELARYRPGLLICDPAVAHLRVSGSISLDDTDAGLALLADSLPIRVVRRTNHWVTVLPR
ncbi:DUF4880 domain-containing protein [Corticibacter populi]|uniref:DUF4880 domain-containing protein n=1 Tax=Corticibacter populi TaxID=1550736 RepID=A0A3M6R0L2_9BURK|nr:FecR domain-containing protein [Corticibacter populi]RMX08745.1 DUF4880 domain-containing protein [Corticibacter populi]